MTTADFRQLALSFPDAVESAHMGHPDFRVGGKIFATLDAAEKHGMVKLPPAQQASLLRTQRGVFKPAAGAWGKWGCTMITLADADVPTVRQALAAAWRNTAPKRLVKGKAGE